MNITFVSTDYPVISITHVAAIPAVAAITAIPAVAVVVGADSKKQKIQKIKLRRSVDNRPFLRILSFMKELVRYYRRLKDQYAVFAQKKYTTMAGVLVFFLILSVVPFSFWVILLFGEFLAGSEEILSHELYEGAGEILGFLQQNAKEVSGGATFFLGATTLYSASNFFYHLRQCGEIIYGVPREKRGWAVRLSALVATLITVLLLGLFWGLFLGMVWVFNKIFPLLIARMSSYFLSAAIEFLTCLALNSYLCPFRLRWKNCVKGSLVTTLLWGIALAGFSFYIRFGNISKLYGAMTTVVVTLIWTYCMMICFVVGIIVNEQRRGRAGALKRF